MLFKYFVAASLCIYEVCIDSDVVHVCLFLRTPFKFDNIESLYALGKLSATF